MMPHDAHIHDTKLRFTTQKKYTLFQEVEKGF